MEFFTARVGSKVVTYPQHATFVIDQRKIGRAFTHVASKPSFAQALSKFVRAHRPGHVTRLSYTDNGRMVTVLREK